MDNWFMRILRMFTGEETPPWWLNNWKELTVALILLGIAMDAFIYLVKERPAWFVTLLRKVGLATEGDRPDTLRPKKRPAQQEAIPPEPAPPASVQPKPVQPQQVQPQPVQPQPVREARSEVKQAPIAARPPSARPVDTSPRPKGVIAQPIRQPEYDDDGEPKRVRLAPRDVPEAADRGNE